MPTDKYDLHTIDYSVQGWDSIMTTDMERLDAIIHTYLLLTLGETVETYQAVYFPVIGTKVMLAQANGLKQPALGLAVEGGVLNDRIRVQRVGPITNAGWSWTLGKPVYLSSAVAGALTHTPSGQFMGIPSGATTLILAGTIDVDSLAITTTTTTTTSSSTSSTSSTISTTSSTSSTSSTISTTSSTSSTISTTSSTSSTISTTSSTSSTSSTISTTSSTSSTISTTSSTSSTISTTSSTSSTISTTSSTSSTISTTSSTSSTSSTISTTSSTSSTSSTTTTV